MNAQLYIKRREKNLKQVQVAEMLNIRPETYGHKESGRAFFTLPEAIKLAKLFNCSLDELFMN